MTVWWATEPEVPAIFHGWTSRNSWAWALILTPLFKQFFPWQKIFYWGRVKPGRGDRVNTSECTLSLGLEYDWVVVVS
jgi:hypothetical protein